MIAAIPRDPQYFLPPCQNTLPKLKHPITPFNLFAKEIRKPVEEQQRGSHCLVCNLFTIMCLAED